MLAIGQRPPFNLQLVHTPQKQHRPPLSSFMSQGHEQNAAVDDFVLTTYSTLPWLIEHRVL